MGRPELSHVYCWTVGHPPEQVNQQGREGVREAEQVEVELWSSQSYAAHNFISFWVVQILDLTIGVFFPFFS